VVRQESLDIPQFLFAQYVAMRYHKISNNSQVVPKWFQAN
jgi:hypothetical protein